MIYEEAIQELEWIYQNGFENDLSIIGTDRILDAIRIAIEALEKLSVISNEIESLEDEALLTCSDCRYSWHCCKIRGNNQRRMKPCDKFQRA